VFAKKFTVRQLQECSKSVPVTGFRKWLWTPVVRNRTTNWV